MTKATPGCMWYWDGEAWSKPNAVGGCTTCQNSTQPTINLTEPCYVLVDCPGNFGADDKRFIILIPDSWKGKLDKYQAAKKDK